MICSEALVHGIINKLKKDVLRYAPAAFVPAGVSVASVAIFTRLFGTDAYGRYSLVLAASSIMTTLLAGWIQQSVLRYLPRCKASGDLQLFMERFAAVLSSVSMTALAIFLLLYPLLKDALSDYRRFYFPGAALVLTGVIFQVLTSVFQAELKSGRYAKYKIAYAVGRLGLALAFVFLVSRDVIGLIFAMAASYMVLIVCMKWELGMWSALKAARRSFDFAFLKKFAAYGFPMIGWLMGGQILAISDRFVIGAFRSQSEVGIYSANYSIVGMGIGLITGPLIMAAHPLLVNAWEKEGRSAVPGLISMFSRYYLLLIVPVVFFVGVFCQDAVDVLLGEEYREGFGVIPFVLAGHMMWGLAMYGQKGFELLEKTGSMLVLVAVCSAFNIVLNLLLVPAYGYFAAAVTTFASYLLYPVLIIFASRSILAWRLPWASVCRILASASLTALVLMLARKYWLASLAPVVTIVIGGAICSIVYVALLRLMKELR